MAESPDRTEPLARLLEVMAALRGEEGCPWDRRQTHGSLVPYLIEEAYEVVDAIEGGGDGALREELGDLLLQVVFHAQIAAEDGRFDFHDVAEALAAKLVDRHPHVFAGLTVDSPRELRRMWHNHKMKHRRSAVDGVPRALPGLQRAAKVSRAAAQAGFEWRHMGEILAKTREELDEFAQAVHERESKPEDGDREAGQAESELGDLLFALVQVARWQRIDPESALRKATAKFTARFRWMEERLREEGQDTIPERWEALWADAKAAIPE